MSQIQLARSDDDIARCFPVMAELRTHLKQGEFVERIRRQQRDGGYALAFLEEEVVVRAVAGYRIAEFLAWGRILYVDDLVTAAAERSRGWGRELFDWLMAMARAQGCEALHLDSGVEKHGAHRFYLRHHMAITAHHFAVKLGTDG